MFGPDSPASTVPFHLEHPEISVEDHFLAKSAERAALVNARTSIYLDTKFWIKLRDAMLGRPQEPADAALYSALRTAVRGRRAVCPFSADMFLEFMRIGDGSKRLAAARVVDELSLCVTLRTEKERVQVEFNDFIRRSSHRTPVRTAADSIWTCPGYVAGFLVPSQPGLDPKTQLALQKAFLDHLYTSGFAEQSRLRGEAPSSARAHGDLAERMNRLNQDHAGGMRSLKQVTADEFRGALDFHLPTIEEVLVSLGEAELGYEFTDADIARANDSARKIAAIIAALFEKGRIGSHVPTLVIRANLCAAVRWDRHRKYVENDFRDFGHAASALPYFDVFATEHSLAHLVTNQLKLDQRYETKVVTTSGQLLAAVSAL